MTIISMKIYSYLKYFMFQELVSSGVDPQFISENQIFDVVPGKLGNFFKKSLYPFNTGQRALKATLVLNKLSNIDSTQITKHHND